MGQRYSNNSKQGMEAGVADFDIQTAYDNTQKELLANKLGNFGSPQTMTAGPNTQEFDQRIIEASILKNKMQNAAMPQMKLDAAAADDMAFKQRKNAYLLEQAQKAALANSIKEKSLWEQGRSILGF